MTSRRSWLLGLALGAFLSVSAAQAQPPRVITYQGMLLNGTKPDNGNHTFKITLYDALGTVIYTETLSNQPVVNGIFNLEIAKGVGGFPATIDFNQQYFLGVAIDGGAELTPRTDLNSVPYALNSGTVNGIPASKTPVPGALIPLDATGKFPLSVLPTPAATIASINNVTGNAQNNINLVAGTNITITPNGATNSIKIDASGGASGITTVLAGSGLTGGGSTPTVMLSLAPGGITGVEIANGAISGRKMDPFIAGDGLYQDALGNLNVGVDNQTIETNNDVLRVKSGGIGTLQLADGSVTTVKIANGAVTAAKVDPTQIQLRVTGVSPNGFFMQSVNQDGTVNSGTVLVDNTLNRAITANNLTLGINLANPNTWTGLQNFNAGATATSLIVNGPTTHNGNITQTSGSTTLLNTQINGTLGVSALSTFTGTVNNGNSLINGNLTVTGTSDLRGNITNTTGPLNFGPANANFQGVITAPANGHNFGTLGTDGNVVTINGAVGNAGTELRVFGDETVSGNVGISGVTTTQTINATTVNASSAVNTPNIGGVGGVGTLTLTSPLNAGVFPAPVQNITGGSFTGYTLNNGSISVGSTLTNNGTINNGAITNATITGGSINNTPIGQATPNAGSFTFLNSSNNTVLGTGAGTVNSFGSGNNSNNNIGGGSNTVNFLGTGAGATNSIGSLTGTNSVLGLTNVGSAAANGNKLIVNGVVSPGVLTAADYEFIVNGDAQITGTLSILGAFNATTFTATNVFTTNLGGNPIGSPINLLSDINGSGPAKNINNVNIGNVTPGTGAFTTLSSTSTTSLATGSGAATTIGTPLGTTTINGQTIHNGAGIPAGTNVITVNNVPAGQYGLAVNSPANANGIKLTNATGTGTGINVDPYATGIAIANGTLGINIVGGTNGIAISGGTGTGVNISGDPASILATGTIITTGQGSAFGSTTNAGTSVSINNNGQSSALVVNGGTTLNAVAGGTAAGLTFNTGPSTSNFDIIGTGNTWNVTKGGVITSTSVFSGPGSFTTLTSSGNSTIGTGAGLTNTFGSGGTATNSFGANATTNNIGVGATTNNIGSTPASANTITGNLNTIVGATNVNTVAGQGATSIGNTTNTLTMNGSTTSLSAATSGTTSTGTTSTNTVGTAYTLSSGTTSTFNAVTSNTLASATNNINGTTANNITSPLNTVVGNTNINTGLNQGNTNIGNSNNTQLVSGLTTFDGTGVAAATSLVTMQNPSATAGSWDLRMNYNNGTSGGAIISGTNGNAIQVQAGVNNGLQVTSPNVNGVNLLAMAGATGVNYVGTTGTGLNTVTTSGFGVNTLLTGNGVGVSSRVNNMGVYGGPSAAVAGVNTSAGVVGLSGITANTNAVANNAGVYGETNSTNTAGTSGVNSTVGSQGAGLYGSAPTATSTRLGVMGVYNAGSTNSYGVMGTNQNIVAGSANITDAATMGLSNSNTVVAVGADNSAINGTAIRAFALGGGSVRGESITIAGAGGFTGTVPNSAGLAIDYSSGGTAGIYIKGTGAGVSSYVPATGTGIYIDPVTTGIVAVATGIGAELVPQTNGVGLGANVGIGGLAWATGMNVNATGTGMNINSGATSIQATGSINTNGSTGTGSLFTGNSAGVTTLTVNNTNNSNAPALNVGGATTTSGNTTLATNVNTTNTFGNSAGATNSIGNGAGGTQNTIGGNATLNSIGVSAATNNFGGTATANGFGVNAGSNQFGNLTTAPAGNQFGNGGSTNNNFGGNTTGTNNFGSTTGTNNYNGVSNFLGTTHFGANLVDGSNFVITGSSINNTVIGNITPSTGAFTTLTSNGASTIGTAAGLTNTFGNGGGATTNNIGAGGGTTTNNLGTGGGTTANNIGSQAGLNTVNGTTTFNGTGIAGGTNNINVTNVPAGSYGIGINAPAGALGGIKVTGAGAGTGINIDPFAIGIKDDATAQGMVITTAPNSITASGTIIATGITNAGSQFNGNTPALGSSILTVQQTGNGPALTTGTTGGGNALVVNGPSTFSGLVTGNGGGNFNTFNVTGLLTAGSEIVTGNVQAGSFNNTAASFVVTGAGDITGRSITLNPNAAVNGITINNLGTGFDAQGTGNTWNITKTGVATFTSIFVPIGTFTTVNTTNLRGNPNGTPINVGDALSMTTNNITTTTGTYTSTTGAITTGGLINGGSFQNTGNSFNVNGAGAVTGTAFNGGTGSFTTLGSTGNSNIGTGAGTTNSFGNGGGATINNIGNNATQNQFGVSAVSNQFGGFGGNNLFGSIGATTNGFGTGTTGPNTFGTTAVGGTNTYQGTSAFSGIINMTSATTPLQMQGVNGTAGQVLISNGAGATPSWSSTPAITVPFNNITSGNNTGQTLTIGNGSTLSALGTGVINATQLLGNTWAVPQAIGSTTPNTGNFTTLTANPSGVQVGLTVNNTGAGNDAAGTNWSIAQNGNIFGNNIQARGGTVTAGVAGTATGSLQLKSVGSAVFTTTITTGTPTASGTVTTPKNAQGTMGVYLTATQALVAGTAAVTVAGAETGDPVLVTYTSMTNAGSLSATVTAANTVTITSSSSTDVSTVRVIVLKQP